MSEGDWWWCLRHGQVEHGADCPNQERMGPYVTKQEAATVLERTAARTAEQDARDAADDEWGERP